MKLSKLTDSLTTAGVNAAFAVLAFLLFIYPRFTNLGGDLCPLILFVLAIDFVLILRDLSKSGTRIRAVIALLLWLPLLFLFLMINQWEGPLYAAARGNPPMFEARGLAGLCGVDLYGPEHENAEWYGDDVGLLWSIDHTVRFPFEAAFKYGEVPSGFQQTAPAYNTTPPPLDPEVTYTLVLNRCMGGPQYLSLRGDSISEDRPTSNACWGELQVPERHSSAFVRVDCKTHQALPMSKRAAARLKDYRENRIPYY